MRNWIDIPDFCRQAVFLALRNRLRAHRNAAWKREQHDALGQLEHRYFEPWGGHFSITNEQAAELRARAE